VTERATFREPLGPSGTNTIRRLLARFGNGFRHETSVHCTWIWWTAPIRSWTPRVHHFLAGTADGQIGRDNWND
jgi:hypothetical protein